MEKQKFPILDHLNPLKDVDYMRTLSPSDAMLMPYRNFVRGAIAGALTGLALDQAFGNGGLDLALLGATLGAVPDFVQGLGRGAMEIVNPKKSV